MKQVKFKKPNFNKDRAQRLINKIFKDSKITSYKKLEGGLVHFTFKARISNPKKDIVLRLSKRKNLDRVTKNNQILDYLNKNKIPAPKIYLQQFYYGQLITVMEFLKGENAEKAYKIAKQEKRKVILKDVGRVLYEIHKLEIPKIWTHQKHEIKNEREWLRWTKKRIIKYLDFVNRFLPKYHDYLKNELEDFKNILISDKSKIHLVPLHWDYHLANMNVNSEGKVTGAFDFDNCIKGHNLGDIGQTKYWIWFRMKNPDNFKCFLEGYKKNFTKNEIKLIHGYFLLHMIAVTRTIWRKQPRLTWIIEEHKKILDNLMSHKRI